MALRLKDDLERGPGFVLLTFDSALNSPSIEISVLNLYSQLHLGPSAPGKPNWIVPRSHFFQAVRVGGDQTHTTFCVGPDVTTFVPESTLVEIASRDGTIRETVSWDGVLITTNWLGHGWVEAAGRDGEYVWAPIPPARSPVSKSDEKEREATERRIAEAKEKEAREAKEREAKEKEAKEKEAKEQEARKAKEKEEEERKEKEREEARRLAEPKKNEDPKPPSTAKKVIAVSILIAIVAAIAALLNRDWMCSQFGVLCDEEAAAYRTAMTCAAGRTCGANACTGDYLRRFPGGRYSSELTRINAACPPAPRPAPSAHENELYKTAVACANAATAAGAPCRVEACFQALRTNFPGSVHLKTEQIRLQEAAKSCNAIQVNEKLRQQLKELHNTAVSCATQRETSRDYCAVAGCFQNLRSSFPNSSELKAEQARLDTAGRACKLLQEWAVLGPAIKCAEKKPCGASSCFQQYQSQYPNGINRPHMDAALAAAKNACR